ncbi:MAG TPA: hypothetical protein VGE74_12875 [Gemmata sp.]
MTGGPYILEPVYTDEDIEILVTVEDNGEAIAGWALSFRLWRPTGDEVLSGLSVSVTDADGREITATITGLTLAPGCYRWEVRRTDVGARTLLAGGVLSITDERP